MAEASLTERMKRAAKLESELYEEVEADKSANKQALTVVIIAALAWGIGGALAGAIGGGAGNILVGLIVGVVWTILGWLIWSGLTLFIGTKFFKGPETESDFGEMIRTIGFAYTPLIFTALMFIPVLGGLIALGAMIWTLVAVVIAIRQALDFTTGRAIATALVGWVVLLIVYIVTGISVWIM
jgi:hypothetical protein